MKWGAWAVCHRLRESFWASRTAVDFDKEGDDRYQFQHDRRRYRSQEAAQRRADELNESPPNPRR